MQLWKPVLHSDGKRHVKFTGGNPDLVVIWFGKLLKQSLGGKRSTEEFQCGDKTEDSGGAIPAIQEETLSHLRSLQIRSD
ncbi:hypothetical protein C2E31_08325 [Rhodopirellula baltica]|nr:hypothetical protein C2E31_08325 [Rhodopirellula baltica]